MKIIREDNGREGAFKAIDKDMEMGEMTYVWRGKDKILIDHTGVDPEFEGQGVGKRLFDEAVHFAREKEVKIVPICPFVVALCKRDPSTKDIVADY
ncbi:N-acetyltransferase [Bacteroidia bacterium]|nr:N-acetyltransferase [Bacteroidia bacterium]